MDDVIFRKLLDRFDLSWKGYRKVRSGVKKRVRKYMREQGIRDAEQLLQTLDWDPSLRENCERILTVSISRFFRDKKLWEILGDILRKRERLKAWCAGCACGEEVYSLKILWDSLNKAPEKLGLKATDLNPIHLQRAQKGAYSKSSLKEVPLELLDRYFHQQKIDEELKKGIQWEERNLLLPPSDSGYDLIFLRNNLLTYYKNPKAFFPIAEALNPNGMLIIGAHESLPKEAEGLFEKGPHPLIRTLKDSIT